MKVGTKDKRIILQAKAKDSDEQGGKKSLGWVDKATVWSEFWKPKTVTAEATGTMLGELTRSLVIWRRDDVRKGWRVLYGAKIFSVEHAYDYEKTETMLVCKEVVK